MTFRQLVVRYRTYNPVTGAFDVWRSRDAYAALLGVSPPTITRLARGQIAFSLQAARGLARAFPAARFELAEAVLLRDLVA